MSIDGGRLFYCHKNEFVLTLSLEVMVARPNVALSSFAVHFSVIPYHCHTSSSLRTYRTMMKKMPHETSKGFRRRERILNFVVFRKNSFPFWFNSCLFNASL